MKRKATAIWKGSGKDGTGVLTTQSTVLHSAKYSFRTRFEDDPGTNPEELIAAAHAGCFAMKLSFVLGEAGFKPDELLVDCTVEMVDGSIKTSHLDLKAKIPGISQDKFDAAAKDAKENCPISKSLTAKVSLDAKLV